MVTTNNLKKIFISPIEYSSAAQIINKEKNYKRAIAFAGIVGLAGGAYLMYIYNKKKEERLIDELKRVKQTISESVAKKESEGNNQNTRSSLSSERKVAYLKFRDASRNGIA